MADVKNMKKAGEALQKAAKDPKAAMGMMKALFKDKGSKISNTTAILMVGFALGLDIVQLLVAIVDGGYLSGPIAIAILFLVYTLWFALKGVSFWGKSKAASKLVSIIVEEVGGLIPYFNLFWPAATVMVIFAIGITRMEEVAANQPEEKPKEKSADTKTEKKGGPTKPDNVRQPKADTGVDEGIKNKRISGVELGDQYDKAA
jgi:hypothetical protein